MGPGVFPTNPNLADILGRTDLDFGIFYFLDFLGPKFLAWAHLGPTWAHLGPTRAPRGPTHLGPTWVPNVIDSKSQKTGELESVGNYVSNTVVENWW